MIKNISTLSFKIYIGEQRERESTEREKFSLSRSLSLYIYIYADEETKFIHQ